MQTICIRPHAHPGSSCTTGLKNRFQGFSSSEVERRNPPCQALGLRMGPLLLGAMAADNIAMALYIAVIMSIPAEQLGMGEGEAPLTGGD